MKDHALDRIRKHTHTGHLFKSAYFIATLEKLPSRILRALPRGRPKKKEEAKQ